jgi:putative addiction module component (TIGR02574 family)
MGQQLLVHTRPENGPSRSSMAWSSRTIHSIGGAFFDTPIRYTDRIRIHYLVNTKFELWPTPRAPLDDNPRGRENRRQERIIRGWKTCLTSAIGWLGGFQCGITRKLGLEPDGRLDIYLSGELVARHSLRPTRDRRYILSEHLPELVNRARVEPMSDLRNQIETLSAAEKAELLDIVWESLEADAASVTDAQRAELNYRIDRHEKNPSDVIPWEQVRAKLFKKS